MDGCGWGPGGEELETKSGRRLLAGRTSQISSVSGILSFLARRPGVAVLNKFGTTKSTCSSRLVQLLSRKLVIISGSIKTSAL